MDRNLMHACEVGVSYIQNYPHSVAVKPFLDIVHKIITIVDDNYANNNNTNIA